jgi:hypothetical protein
MNPQAMVAMWHGLVAYCQDRANFDQGVFRLKHDEYAGRYKKMPQDQQGEIAAILNGE